MFRPMVAVSLLVLAYTPAHGQTAPPPTLSNLIFSYNALPDLRRTGLF
jgi:hypothetical protein